MKKSSTTRTKKPKKAPKPKSIIRIMYEMLRDPMQHTKLRVELMEMSAEDREALPPRFNAFHATTKTVLAQARMKQIADDQPPMRSGIKSVMETFLGTPAFMAYTRRAYFINDESLAGTARVLGVSRQAVYRHIETVENALEKHVPGVRGRKDNGAFAASLWRELLEKLEFPIDALWAPQKPVFLPEVGTTRRVFQLRELGRLQKMSPEGKKRMEAHLLEKIWALEEQLTAARDGTVEAASSCPPGTRMAAE